MKRKPIKRLFALVLAACLLLAGLPLSAGAAGSPSVSPNDGCTRGQIVTFLYKHYAS